MRRNLLIVLGVLVAAAAALYGRRWLGSGREDLGSPQALAEEALQAPTLKQRESAARRMVRIGKPAAQHLRRVLVESKTPEVRAACIQGLATHWDYDGMPALLDALEDESPLVRGRAGAAVEKMLGADFGFRFDDPPEKRAKSVNTLRQEWARMQNSPVLEDWKKRLQNRR
jgi:HEAT repeat protein